jgi:hypothetical protein
LDFAVAVARDFRRGVQRIACSSRFEIEEIATEIE